MKFTTRNINKVYATATLAEIREGKRWYAQANKDCKAIAAKHDMPLHIVVGVVSALSPNNKWSRNVVNADDVITAFLNGDAIESVKVSTYNTMKAKAWTILEAMPEGHEVPAILNGQKIKSFYACIMGFDTCCVDGHARNIAYGERIGLTDAALTIGKAEYTALQELYRRAAKQLSKRYDTSLTAYEVQAVTWVAWRRSHGIQ